MEGVFIDVTAFLIRFVDFPHGILRDRQSFLCVGEGVGHGGRRRVLQSLDGVHVYRCIGSDEF